MPAAGFFKAGFGRPGAERITWLDGE